MSAQNIKAVILAAGEGKRMRPVSEVVPKEMIPILGKPFLYYVLMKLKEAGARDIVIVTNPNKEPLISKEFGDGRGLGMKITYVTQNEQLGPAHAIVQTKPLIDTDYFLTYYGDSLADVNVPKALLDTLAKNNGDAVLAIREVEDPSRYGIVKFEDDKIVEVVEKPAPGTEPSRFATIGVYLMRTDAFFKAVGDVQFEYGREVFPPQYVLRAGGSAVGWKFEGKRVDLGKPEDILKASVLISGRPIRCVAFDADNTLYSTRAVSKLVDLAAMEVLSKKVGKPAEELYNQFLEIVKTVKDSKDPKVRHRKYSYRRLCDAYGVACVEEMYKAFSELLLKELKPVEGLQEILSILRKKNKKLCVITEDNRSMAVEKLTRLGIADKFHRVITSDDTGTMKPSEAYYTTLLREFKPADVLVVGDTYEKDLLLPARMGMHVLLVQEPKDLESLKTLQ